MCAIPLWLESADRLALSTVQPNVCYSLYKKNKCFTDNGDGGGGGDDDNYHLWNEPSRTMKPGTHVLWTITLQRHTDRIAMRNKNAIANNDRLWIFKMRFFLSLFSRCSTEYHFSLCVIITSWKGKCGDRVWWEGRETITIIIRLNWTYSQFCGNSVVKFRFGSIYPIKLWFSG